MGMLLRLLIFAAVVWLVVRLVKRALAPPAPPPPEFAPMARCARCGVHVPRDGLDKAGLCSRCAAGS